MYRANCALQIVQKNNFSFKVSCLKITNSLCELRLFIFTVGALVLFFSYPGGTYAIQIIHLVRLRYYIIP
jgi:hypothetical protein